MAKRVRKTQSSNAFADGLACGGRTWRTSHTHEHASAVYRQVHHHYYGRTLNARGLSGPKPKQQNTREYIGFNAPRDDAFPVYERRNTLAYTQTIARSTV